MDKLSKKSQDLISKNIDLVNRNIERWIREQKDEEEIKIDWEKLLEFWNKTTGKKTRVITDKAKRQFRARLKEGYVKSDIVLVIRHGFESDHHKESQHKWFTLELCSRAKSFELYLNAKPKNIDPNLNNPFKKQ